MLGWYWWCFIGWRGGLLFVVVGFLWNGIVVVWWFLFGWIGVVCVWYRRVFVYCVFCGWVLGCCVVRFVFVVCVCVMLDWKDRVVCCWRCFLDILWWLRIWIVLACYVVVLVCVLLGIVWYRWDYDGWWCWGWWCVDWRVRFFCVGWWRLIWYRGWCIGCWCGVVEWMGDD